MRQKFFTAYKYQMIESRSSLLSYYGALFAVFLLSAVIVTDSHNRGQIAGVEMCSILFLFVAGITTFGVEMRLYLQCGLSRKLLSLSVLAATVTLALLVICADFLMGTVLSALQTGLWNGQYYSFFEMLFPQLGLPGRLAVQFCVLMAANYAGLLISAVFFQLPKKARVFYCVIVPTLCVVLFFGGPATPTGAAIVDLLLSSPIYLAGAMIGVAGLEFLLCHLLAARSYLR